MKFVLARSDTPFEASRAGTPPPQTSTPLRAPCWPLRAVAPCRRSVLKDLFGKLRDAEIGGESDVSLLPSKYNNIDTSTLGV